MIIKNYVLKLSMVFFYTENLIFMNMKKKKMVQSISAQDFLIKSLASLWRRRKQIDGFSYRGRYAQAVS